MPSVDMNGRQTNYLTAETSSSSPFITDILGYLNAHLQNISLISRRPIDDKGLKIFKASTRHLRLLIRYRDPYCVNSTVNTTEPRFLRSQAILVAFHLSGQASGTKDLI